jgi:hypothetical protein
MAIVQQPFYQHALHGGESFESARNATSPTKVKLEGGSSLLASATCFGNQVRLWQAGIRLPRSAWWMNIYM